MEMDLELEWQDAGWERMIWRLPRGSVIPAQRFFAMLGPVDEEGAREAAQMLTDREVGLDVSGLPRGGYQGAAAERLARESELARRGGLPGALDPGDPLRLHCQDLEALPRLDGQAAQALAGKGAGANRFTEGLLWLVLQEALDFVGQGVLLLDLMQEGAMGLLQAMEHPGADPIERGRWHVRRWPRRWRCSTCPPGKHSGWWRPCGPISRRTGGSWSGWDGTQGRRSWPRRWESR